MQTSLSLSEEAPLEEAETYQEELPYLLALIQVPGFGPQTLRKLFANVGDGKALWAAPLSLLKPHLPPKAVEAFLEARKTLAPMALWERYQTSGLHLVSYRDPHYPPMLNQIHDAPVLLFVKGSLSALRGKTLAFVGTRKVSEYGRQVTQTLIEELSPIKPCIVSGLAEGVDGLAHREALNHGLITIAVFGCGLDIIYPSQHKQLAQDIVSHGGALVSEYPLGLHPTKSTFPARNRIIAGLSYGVVIVEGGIRSGSLITARLALEENRQIYAVPGNIFSPGSSGPLHLIKNGAIPVTSAADILEDLRWLPAEGVAVSSSSAAESPAVSTLSDVEAQVLQAVGYDPTSLEHLQQKTQLDAAKLSEVLTLLEIYGLLTTLPGAKFSRK